MSVHEWTLRQTLDALARGDVSAEELVRAFLDRIERWNPDLVAYVAVADDAVACARRIDERRARGERLGPLAGVPIAVKDLIDTDFLPTGYGGAHFRGHRPQRNATVVRRLLAADAVIIGKTNLHEYAYGTTTENPHYGISRNPWDTTRIAGGSSGGSSVALAAGLCTAALGTDTGGSIRIPAALCGHVGLKPTFGRVSKAGVFPLASSLDHVGPMTKTVEDAALVLDIIAGYDPADPDSARVPVHPFSGSPAAGPIRIGVPRRFFFEHCQEDVRLVVENALRRVEALGLRLVDVDVPMVDEVPEMQNYVISSEAYAVHEERLKEDPERFGEDVRERLIRSGQVRGADYVRATQFRHEFRRRLRELFEQVDVLATPTTPLAATPVGCAEVEVAGRRVPVRGHLTRYTNPWNLSGLPAISLPCGTTPLGLPVGLQLVGPAFAERKLLAVAARVEQTTPWNAVAPRYRDA